MTYQNFNFDIDADGIALVTWNMPGRSMNVIDAKVTEELGAIVEKVATDAAIKGAVLTSGKDAFCAGADLAILETSRQNFTASAKSQGEEAANKNLFEESRKFSLLARRMETCGKPWVAALNGTAMGGGFELALACHHRVASENDKTRLGLPEIKVGLFPGGGGTQRIARMMPPADALQFLLKGDQLRLNRAKSMKLIDEVVPPAELVQKAKDWIKAGGKGTAPWDVDGFKLPGGAVYSKAGMMVFPPANALYRRETYDNYPAARAIMQVVYEGLQLPMDQALRVESRYFAKILRSPEAAAMIRSLFVSMQELNKGARRPPEIPAKPIKKIGVLGAGFMGAGVAYVSAQAGIDVVLIDRDQETADKGKAHSQKLITDQINRGRATSADRDALLAHITATPDYAALKDCDLIIEAVFEDRKVKEEVIANAQAAIGEQTIFGSNTSTLPITSLAKTFKDQPRFIGIHFFSPVDRMMLVEVIMGKKTGDAALAAALDYVRAIRKTPIVVNDFARLLHLARGRHVYSRRSFDADRRCAGGDDRKCRPDGRHAGRTAFSDRRGRRRSRLESIEGNRGRSWRQGDRSAAKSAARRYGREARALRPQEWQGLLRLPADRDRNGSGRASSSCSRPSSIRTPSTSRNSSIGCWRSRRSSPRAASRKAWSPTCAKPTLARSSASAMPRLPAAPSRISTAWAQRPSSICATNWQRNTVLASNRASCCATWRRRATPSITASRRRSARLRDDRRRHSR